MCMYNLGSSSLTGTGALTRQHLCCSSCPRMSLFFFSVGVFQISVRNEACITSSSNGDKPVCRALQAGVEAGSGGGAKAHYNNARCSLANGAKNSWKESGCATNNTHFIAPSTASKAAYTCYPQTVQRCLRVRTQAFILDKRNVWARACAKSFCGGNTMSVDAGTALGRASDHQSRLPIVTWISYLWEKCDFFFWGGTGFSTVGVKNRNLCSSSCRCLTQVVSQKRSLLGLDIFPALINFILTHWQM